MQSVLGVLPVVHHTHGATDWAPIHRGGRKLLSIRMEPAQPQAAHDQSRHISIT
jgi:hypothetical protein